MFVGHYGASFVAKALNKSIPLWILFLAVQLGDVFWAIFVILGIEKVRIVPGITATNPLDLYYLPYTHSLVASILWAVAAGIVSRVSLRRSEWPAGLIVGAAVLSHHVESPRVAFLGSHRDSPKRCELNGRFGVEPTRICRLSAGSASCIFSCRRQCALVKVRHTALKLPYLGSQYLKLAPPQR